MGCDACESWSSDWLGCRGGCGEGLWLWVCMSVLLLSFFCFIYKFNL